MKKIALALLLLFGAAQAKQKDKIHKDHLAVAVQKAAKSKSNHTKLTSKKVIATARSYLGTRYKFGGQSKRGIDCSGFTQAVLKKHKVNLPRTASQQASIGRHINKKNLRKGDLVFFKNTYRRGISHVGIYLGNDRFIHASSSAHKVTISKLSKAYYRKHYAGARRV